MFNYHGYVHSIDFEIREIRGGARQYPYTVACMTARVDVINDHILCLRRAVTAVRLGKIRQHCLSIDC
jgi:hypothetical protein